MDFAPRQQVAGPPRPELLLPGRFYRVFDAITLPGLSADEFVSCDYDSFHSVLRFRRQTVHVLPRFAEPVIILWLKKPGCVDFKSDKQDRVVHATGRKLVVEHPDRGYRF